MTKYSDLMAGLDRVFSKDHYDYFNEELAMSEQRSSNEINFLRCRVGLLSSSSVLDIACGNGRHLISLAPTIAQGVGIDSNEYFINNATKASLAKGLRNLTFQVSDARSLQTASLFNHALMLNGILGVFGEQADFEIIKTVRERLQKGGRFVFNIPNRDTIMREFSGDFVHEKNGDLLIDRCSFDPKTGYITNRRIYIRDGRRLDAPFSYRLYNYTEIERMLVSCGFRVDYCYGDWGGELVSAKSPRLIFVAQRTE